MIKKKYTFCQYVLADVARLGSHGFCGVLRWLVIPKGECYPYVFWLRVVQCVRRHAWSKYSLGVLAYFVLRHYEYKYGIHMNPNVDIGPGLRIVHGNGVFGNVRRIGSGVTIYQGVTLGELHRGVPEVGDGVTIYPNSVVVGEISLGTNSTVGALSYVSKSVPAGVVVVGAPAREIRL